MKRSKKIFLEVITVLMLAADGLLHFFVVDKYGTNGLGLFAAILLFVGGGLGLIIYRRQKTYYWGPFIALSLWFIALILLLLVPDFHDFIVRVL